MARLLRTLTILSLAAILGGCQSPESRMANGDDMFLRGQYGGALYEYQLARRGDPTLPGIDEKIRSAQIRMYIAKGDQYAQRGKWDEARRAYEEVRRIDPNNAEIDERLVELQNTRANDHFARGTQLLSEGNPFDAIPEFEQALALQPDHPRASAAMDRALQQKRDREARAETAYQEGLRARDGGHLEEALRYFTEAVSLDSHHVGAELELVRVESAIVDELVARGDEAMAARRFSDALAAYREAEQREPRRKGLLWRIDRADLETRAESLAAEGDRALARQDWQVAFERFEAASRSTSEPELFQERLDRARDRFAESLLEDALGHQAAGRYDEALAALQRIGEFHPDYRDAHERHATLRENLTAAEQLYGEGCAAQAAGDLLTARDRLAECVRTLADYRDAAPRLVEIRTSITLAERFYDRAMDAERTGERQRARLLYEECLAVVRPFRDASDRLHRLQRHGRHGGATQAELPQYDEACRLQDARDLQKAQKLLLVCRQERPGYRDTAQRIADVEAALAGAEQTYRVALQAEEACELAAAKNFYGQCLAICSPYADVEERLRRVKTALRDLREARRLDREGRLLAARERYMPVLEHYPAAGDARQRVDEIDRVCADLEVRYRKMQAHERAGNYRLALLTALEIHKRCLEFKDVDGSIERLECEADYADGLAFEDLGRPDAALRCYERCEQRAPQFRDVRDRVRDCRRRLGVPRPRPGGR